MFRGLHKRFRLFIFIFGGYIIKHLSYPVNIPLKRNNIRFFKPVINIQVLLFAYQTKMNLSIPVLMSRFSIGKLKYIMINKPRTIVGMDFQYT